MDQTEFENKLKRSQSTDSMDDVNSVNSGDMNNAGLNAETPEDNKILSSEDNWTDINLNEDDSRPDIKEDNRNVENMSQVLDAEGNIARPTSGNTAQYCFKQILLSVKAS